MKSSKEWCQFEWENPLMTTGDFIAEIQKDAYNQAIEDAISAEWRQHNGIEFTDEEMRAKIKIK